MDRRVAARRLLLPGLLASVALVTAVAPVTAWHLATDSAPRTTVLAQKHHAGPPIRDRGDALRAGGRRAHGPRRKTVVRHGVDISHWQGRIDWQRLAQGGVDFVIAKATEGTWMVDPTYDRNRKAAARVGIRFTAYHYANPSRERGDAKREADWFVRHAKLTARHLVPALDLEETGGLGQKALRRWTLQFLRRVEKRLGVRPMIYTSPGFWSGAAGDSTNVVAAGFDRLWVSHWGVRRPTVPARRWGGSGWTMWQWTSRGRVPGIDGPVDRNVYSGPKLARLTIGAQRHDHHAKRGGHRAHHPHRPRPHTAPR